MVYKKILLYSIFLLISCASTKNDVKKVEIPDWINKYKEKYPDNKYISYLAISDAKIIAERQAMIGISSQFQVDIKSKLDSQEKITENNTDINKEYSINEDIQIVSEQELKNIKISETFNDIKNNKFYVLATLDKIETAKIYLNEVSKLESDFKSYYSSFQNEYDVIEKYKMINKCIYLEQQIRIINSKLEVLGSKRLEHSKYDNLYLIKRKLANEITFNISNENEKIYLSLKNSITGLGFNVVTNNAKLIVEYIYDVKESSIKNKDVSFVNWDITINIIKENKIILSYKKNGRSSQKSLDSAMERAYYDINTDILEKFNEYLNHNL